MPRVCRLALLIGAMAGVPTSLAGPSDALHLTAGLGYFHDDNLFRLPEEVPGFLGQRSDSARQTQVGLLFDKMYGRQKLFAKGELTKVKFDFFDQLDYDGKDVQALWKWQLGNHLAGSLGANYEQTLAPYTDFRSSERNLREHRRQYFDGSWRMHPSWALRTAASQDEYTYELQAQRFNNRDEDAAEIGVDYLPRSGSTVGLVARKIKGKYQNRRSVDGQLLDESFDQDELKARISWIASGSTNVQVLAGYASRKYRALAERDASGFNGRVTATYVPRGKMKYNAAAWREFSAVESNIISYSLNKGASAGATWEVSAKVRVDANASYEKRSYNARVLLSTAQDLNDSLKKATLSTTWQPRPTIAVTAALAHQTRSGSPFLGLGRFKANTVSINANAQF
jgi:exopolysaccharide biosynthesis operon protein EpsL